MYKYIYTLYIHKHKMKYYIINISYYMTNQQYKIPHLFYCTHLKLPFYDLMSNNYFCDFWFLVFLRSLQTAD